MLDNDSLTYKRIPTFATPIGHPISDLDGLNLEYQGSSFFTSAGTHDIETGETAHLTNECIASGKFPGCICLISPGVKSWRALTQCSGGSSSEIIDPRVLIGAESPGSRTLKGIHSTGVLILS